MMENRHNEDEIGFLFEKNGIRKPGHFGSPLSSKYNRELAGLFGNRLDHLLENAGKFFSKASF